MASVANMHQRSRGMAGRDPAILLCSERFVHEWCTNQHHYFLIQCSLHVYCRLTCFISTSICVHDCRTCLRYLYGICYTRRSYIYTYIYIYVCQACFHICVHVRKFAFPPCSHVHMHACLDLQVLHMFVPSSLQEFISMLLVIRSMSRSVFL